MTRVELAAAAVGFCIAAVVEIVCVAIGHAPKLSIGATVAFVIAYVSVMQNFGRPIRAGRES